MKLSYLHPNLNTSSPEHTIQEVLRAILVRTNLVPGIRHTIGWRGLKDSSHRIEAWTAKIAALPGVFGIAFDQSEADENWVTGQFTISYFPMKDEELVENLSIQAGILTQQPDYLIKVRDFSLYPEYCELFQIGSLGLSVSSSEDAMLLDLESLSRQVIYSRNGIFSYQDNERLELVPAGGIDQNFPAFRVATECFRVFAASVTFNLGEPPAVFEPVTGTGYHCIYDAETGLFETIESENIQRKGIRLGYGKIKNQVPVIGSLIRDASGSTTWTLEDTTANQYIDETWWNAHRIGDMKSEKGVLDGIDNRPQLIVVTGFLGAGKTSFLQHFIEYQSQFNRFTAIIQNEIGEIGLDAKLLDQDFAVTEMDEGCVCCTLVGNLKSAIHGILNEYHPDYILLETTGVANPYNLLDELDELGDLVRFDSVTTLVDGLNMAESLKRYEIATSQIMAADLLILNKVDQLSTLEQSRIRFRLRELNADAPIVQSSHGDVNPALLFFQPGGMHKPQKNNEAANTHHHECREDHHHSHSTDSLSSIKLELPQSLDQQRLIEALKDMPPEVFRIKGVVTLDQYKTPMLVQYVGGRFEISQYPKADSVERYLIVIGQNLPDSFSNQSFTYLTG